MSQPIDRRSFCTLGSSAFASLAMGGVGWCRTPERAHLLGSKAQFSAWTNDRSGVRQQIRQRILSSADEFLQDAPPAEIPRGQASILYNDLYVQTHHALRTLCFLEHYTFAWQISGHEAFLSQARRWLLALAAWPGDWGTPYSITRYLRAMAHAYDGIGAELAPKDRTKVKDVLAERAGQYYAAYAQPKAEDTSLSPHHAIPEYAGLGFAALSLLGEMSAADRWLECVVSKMERHLIPTAFGPDGGATAGLNFWTVQNHFLLPFLHSLQTVTGRDLHPGALIVLRRAAQWPMAAYTGAPVPEKRLFEDSENLAFAPSYGQLDSMSGSLLRLAGLLRDPSLQWLGLQDPNLGKIQVTRNRAAGGSAQMFAPGPFAFISYDASLEPAPPASYSAKYCEDVEQVLIRDRREKKNFFIGISGRAQDSFNLLDLVIAANGVGLCGMAQLPGNIRYNNQHPNTISFQGEDQVDGRVECFSESPAYSYTRVNAQRFVRHVFYLGNGIAVLFDEVHPFPLPYRLAYQGGEPLPAEAFVWKLHSRGMAEATESGFVVRRRGAALTAQVLAPLQRDLTIEQLPRIRRVSGGALDFDVTEETQVARIRIVPKGSAPGILGILSTGETPTASLLKGPSPVIEVGGSAATWTIGFNSGRAISQGNLWTDAQQCAVSAVDGGRLRSAGMHRGTRLEVTGREVLSSSQLLDGGLQWEGSGNLEGAFQLNAQATVRFASPRPPRFVSVNGASLPFVYHDEGQMCEVVSPAGRCKVRSGSNP